MDPKLWTEAPLLAVLSWLPVPLGALLVWLPAWPPFARRFGDARLAAPVFLLTRVGFLLLVFGVYRHFSSDWQGYIEQGRAALAGRLPYREFHSLYAPGMPYLLGASLLLSPTIGPLLLFLLADFGAYLALAAVARDQRPRPDSALWAYVAFPPVWYFQARYAQDETLAALFAALAWLLLVRGRPGLAGAALAAGHLCTKILFGLVAVPFIAARRAATATRLGYLIPVATVYLLLAAAGLPWLSNLQRQADVFGQGPTLWRLPAQLWGWELGRFALVPFVVLFLVGWARLWRRNADAIELAAWTWGSYALLAPKLLPMYVVMATPPLAIWVARGAGHERLAWWAWYGLALCTAWYADSGPLQGMFGPAWAIAGAVGVLLPVVLSAWLLFEVWRGRTNS